MSHSIDLIWVVHPVEEQPHSDPATLIGSTIASQRLRVALPSIAINHAGLTQRTAVLRSEKDLAEILALGPRLVIFSKLLASSALDPHLDRHVQLARALACAQIPILVDICDNPFMGITSPYVQRLVTLATHVTVNSPAMADIVATRLNPKISVIPDPVEGIQHTPYFKPPRPSYIRRIFQLPQPPPLMILWFGGPLRSFESLRLSLSILRDLATRQPVDLHLVSAPFSEIQTEIERINSYRPSGLSARFTAWSPLALANALAATDLVFLPGEADNPEKIGVSTNRLTESIWAGRVVVASGMPSYWQFKEGAFIGDDLAQSIAQTLNDPFHALSRITIGQHIVAAHYTPNAVGRLWVTLCTELTKC